VIIRTPDLSQAIHHYESIMGFAIFHHSANMVGFETGSFRLYIESGPAHPPVFDMLVDDVQAAKAAMLAAGCELLEEDPQQPRCYVRDRFGLTFNLGRTAS
jgi:catechol 2,3-dioxygenase-like lactoylglutathione lyase family enzyme